MAVKAINNLAKLNRIVPIFLVFKAYPRITEMDTPLLSITKRAKATQAAIKEIHYL